MPNDAQRRVLDATLVAIAEHGLVPSVQASRMTLAAAPEALQGAVAAGILGCGSVILGATQNAGRSAARSRDARRVGGRSTRREASGRASIAPRSARFPATAIRCTRAPIRASCACSKSQRQSVAAAATSRRRTPSSASCPSVTGKQLVMNVSAAIPAVLLDAGFPLAALKGVPILARTASLIAHLLEEQSRPIGFVLSHAGAAAIDYDGPAPAGFVARDQ